ncbi:MAG: hypothetical protein Q6366_000375 [Candidatus Freyarchaeota archaeon]
MVNRTRKKLKKSNGRKLAWELERSLVNDVLSEQFRRYLDLENAARILNQLAEGLGAAARMIASHFPMNLLGVEAVHRGRVQLGLGEALFCHLSGWLGGG